MVIKCELSEEFLQIEKSYIMTIRLRIVLVILGGTQILRAEPSASPTVKSAGKLEITKTY